LNKQIFAIGGMETLETWRYLRNLIPRNNPRPRIALVPTAAGDSPEAKFSMLNAATMFEFVPSFVCLFSNPTGDLRGQIVNSDVVYVCGGSCLSMLGAWQAWNMDEILKEAYSKGVILAGNSAGAECWFEQCVIDPPPYITKGLGILPGFFWPHFEVERHEINSYPSTYGYAVESTAALHFVNGKVRKCVGQKAWKYHDGDFDKLH
jgi:dipeptidase E